MSAKLTVIFYILICFEIGALLVFLPWYSYWNDNYFLYYAASQLHWQGLIELMHSGYMRGAVSGLGVINLLIGGWEILNFKRTVKAISEEEKQADESAQTKNVALLDNQPPNP
ncbi:MAG: hypothetical protein AB1489_03550 [Acidobacteriota bacterium]